MKQFAFLSLLFVLFFSNGHAQQQVLKKYPAFTFKQKHYDLGTLHEGDVVERTYTFTNTGNAPLLISGIRASCGCTVPSGWKKTPIMPGEQSSFKVRFNSRNKIHKQHKTITIKCNTKSGVERVDFVADVIPDPKMEKMRAERRKRWMERRAQAKKQQALKNQRNPQRQKAFFNKQDVKSQKKAAKIEKKQAKIAAEDLKNKAKINKREKAIIKLEKKIQKEESKLRKLRQKLEKQKQKLEQLK